MKTKKDFYIGALEFLASIFIMACSIVGFAEFLKYVFN